MSEKEIVQRAFKEALKQIDDKKVDEIKALVLRTLEAKEEAEKRRAQAVKDIQLLKKDLDDLRSGDIESLRERHEADKTADNRSPVTTTIIKNIFYGYVAQPWYVPVPAPPVWVSPYQCNTFSVVNTTGSAAPSQISGSMYVMSANSVSAAVSGTYNLTNGNNIYF